MLKKLYITVVVNILQFFNYNKIENEKGTNHVVLNVIDLLLAFIYLLFSYWKLKEVTAFVFVMNLLTLSRLIVSNIKNSISMREQYVKVYLKRPGLRFKSAYDIKLAIDFCVIAFTFVPFWLQGVAFEEYVIRSCVGTIIFIGFIENLINIFVALFQASIEINRPRIRN